MDSAAFFFLSFFVFFFFFWGGGLANCSDYFVTSGCGFQVTTV